MKRITSMLAAAGFGVAMAGEARAQSAPISAAERMAAVEGVARQIEDGYVFAETGQAMAADLRERAARGEYDDITDGDRLAGLLTEQLRAVGHDLHVAVHYSPEILPTVPEGALEPTGAERDRFRADLAHDNYGFRRAEILPGNIGYLRFDVFAPPELAAETYVAAVGFVAETDALIIDLRENGGSLSPDAIPFLASYFFARPTHLIDLKWNTEPAARQLWTWAHVPGRRYLDKPVYILTSRRTFSGAEEFAYDLQNLKRATLVGDTTGGGANPGGTRRASAHFEVFVPFGRVTSPITGTNWEGVGVVPDFATSPAKALLLAQREALRTLRSRPRDERHAGSLHAAQAEVEKELGKFRSSVFRLAGYAEAQEVFVAGAFNGWSPRATPMTRSGDVWTAPVELGPGRQTYKFIVDGEWMTDPANPDTEADGEYVNSVIVVGG